MRKTYCVWRLFLLQIDRGADSAVTRFVIERLPSDTSPKLRCCLPEMKRLARVRYRIAMGWDVHELGRQFRMRGYKQDCVLTNNSDNSREPKMVLLSLTQPPFFHQIVQVTSIAFAFGALADPREVFSKMPAAVSWPSAVVCW